MQSKQSTAPKRPEVQRNQFSQPLPDKLYFCSCRGMEFVQATGRAGVSCSKCTKKMTVIAEFPKGTWT